MIIVDPDDAWLLSAYAWRIAPDGYVVRSVRGKPVVRLHRQIMGAAVDQVVDHVNGVRHDCRRANLRFATRAQNAQNMRPKRGLKGVELLTSGHYRARICVSGKLVPLGTFTDKPSAMRAYDLAAQRLFGEFACTNKEIAA